MRHRLYAIPEFRSYLDSLARDPCSHPLAFVLQMVPSPLIPHRWPPFWLTIFSPRTLGTLCCIEQITSQPLALFTSKKLWASLKASSFTTVPGFSGQMWGILKHTWECVKDHMTVLANTCLLVSHHLLTQWCQALLKWQKNLVSRSTCSLLSEAIPSLWSGRQNSASDLFCAPGLWMIVNQNHERNRVQCTCQQVRFCLVAK